MSDVYFQYIAYGNHGERPYWNVGAVKTYLRRGGEGVEFDTRIADHSYHYIFEKRRQVYYHSRRFRGPPSSNGKLV